MPTLNKKKSTDDVKKNIPNLGYACINLSLKPQKICCNKTCRLATIQKHHQIGGSNAVLEFLTGLSLNNLKHLKIIIQWHIDHNFHFYRLSSDMFPHISQPELKNLLSETDINNYQTLEFAEELLEEIGLMAHSGNIRLTMHPGQFNQIGSPTEKIVEKTFHDLICQNRILDIMENAILKKFQLKDAMKNSILCIHGGGVYGNKEITLQRWKTNFKLLPKEIQRRIALENCEKGYSVEDLLPICQELKIPLILDFHHYNCYNNYHPNETQKSLQELLPLILDTWKVREMKPKFHLSDQAQGKMIGAHHDYVESIPNELLTLMQTNIEFDIMIEAKCKDFAVFKLLQKYPQLQKDCIIPVEWTQNNNTQNLTTNVRDKSKIIIKRLKPTH